MVIAALITDAPDEAAQLGNLVVIESTRRLVEQEKPRPRRERAGELDALLRADRQVGDRPPRHGGELERLDELPGRGFQRVLLAPHPGQTERVAREIAGAHRWPPTRTLSSTDMVRNSARFWKVRRNTQCGDPVRTHSQDAVAGKADVAAIRRIDARQAIEQRGLAGAVRPDQAEDLAFAEIKDTPSSAMMPPNRMPTSQR